MAERELIIDSVDPLLLFGFNDAYLRRVESTFPKADIIARGNRLILNADARTLDQIERVVNELTLMLNRNGNLTQSDVDTVLALKTIGEEESDEGARDVVLFTYDGGSIRAKTPNQHRLVEAARENDVVFAIGPAGTGKTYTAVALAVAALKSRQVKKIVLSRPAVEAGEQLGFLPGDLREKVDPYLRPLYDALGEMMPREKLAAHLEQGIIEIVPLAYMRGRTLNNAFVIMDEAQNATGQQMKMFLTRLGANSRSIITGDITQTDLPRQTTSGLIQVQEILGDIEGISFIYFDRSDVVRHQLVRDIIEAYDEYEENQ